MLEEKKILKGDFVTSHRDLKVFQRVYVLALEVHKASLGFPKIEQYVLADQLRRSTKSICANIAEGFMRQRDSKAEWRRFLMISLASAEESMMWLDFALDLKYISQDSHVLWKQELVEICKMLHKLREVQK